MPTLPTQAEDDTPQRRGWLLAVVLLVAAGGCGAYEFLGKKPALVAKVAPRQYPVIVCPIVDPTPRNPKPKEPEPAKPTPDRPKILVEDKPIPAPPSAPPIATPPPLGTNLAAGGPPDSFHLGSYQSGDGGVVSGTIGGTRHGGGGSRFGSYAAQVQSRNERVKQALFADVEAKIWVDNLGKIQRAKVFGSNGTPSDQDLIGLQLTSPPPDDMPMPIVLRLNARKSTL